jgi:hypothetical protein
MEKMGNVLLSVLPLILMNLLPVETGALTQGKPVLTVLKIYKSVSLNAEMESWKLTLENNVITVPKTEKTANVPLLVLPLILMSLLPVETAFMTKEKIVITVLKTYKFVSLNAEMESWKPILENSVITVPKTEKTANVPLLVLLKPVEIVASTQGKLVIIALKISDGVLLNKIVIPVRVNMPILRVTLVTMILSEPASETKTEI